MSLKSMYDVINQKLNENTMIYKINVKVRVGEKKCERQTEKQKV